MTFTFAGLVRDLAARAPDAPALTFEGASTTFAEFDARSSRLAQALRAAGVGPGDRVGFLGKNSPVFYELTAACSKLDAVTVGLNWRLSTYELADIVADARLTLVVAAPEQARLLDHHGGGAHSPRVLLTGAEYEAAIGDNEPVDRALSTGPESVLFQLYSSGTTGLPKGTLITNANMEFTQQSGRLLYGMDEHSVNLVVSPLFHIGGAGYGMTALSQGGQTVLLADADPVRILRAIEEHHVTHAFLVPAIVQSLLAAPELADTDLSSLQTVAYGGAPMGEALLLRAINGLGCRFLGVYGMTETAGTVIALAADDHDPGGPRAHLLRSIGKPLPWMGEAQVRDPMTSAEARPGEVGEIWVRSGQVTPGYWQQPETTAQALTADGWLRTGDAAYRDDHGYFFLHDRMKDMIITGGENVYPAEIENIMAHHPAVVEVAVIGVPSERWGETVKALVVADPAIEVTQRELIDFTRERLAHYKCPTSVDFVDSLARNASGKLLKTVLRKPYWQQGEEAR